MRILVIGAGVVGTTCAWYLAKAGHQVVIVDRRDAPGLETSYANAGQIAASHAQPWGSPGTPARVAGWLLREDAPLLFRLRADPAQWRWALALLRECRRDRYERNLANLASLARYSRDLLRALRRATGIRYDQLARGILNFYTDSAAFEAATAQAQSMREFGIEQSVLSPDEARRVEPALRALGDSLAGATFAEDDETGDAHRFTRELARACEHAGVRWRLRTRVLALEREGDRVVAARIARDESAATERLSAEAFVLCAGVESTKLAAGVGLKLQIHPVKGYSATVPIVDPSAAPVVSLSDDTHRIAITRLGQRLRIAGTAEFAGYDLELNRTRCDALIRHARRLIGDSADWSRVEFWAGLRPSTPSNLPYLGPSPLRGLYLNTGHGTLGWTLACGSGKALADIVSGRAPEVDFAFAR